MRRDLAFTAERLAIVELRLDDAKRTQEFAVARRKADRIVNTLIIRLFGDLFDPDRHRRLTPVSIGEALYLAFILSPARSKASRNRRSRTRDHLVVGLRPPAVFLVWNRGGDVGLIVR